MRIEVTQADIDAGSKRNCHECPVAQSLRRAFPKSKVFAGPVTLYAGGFSTETPDHVEIFMNMFDAGLPVAPFTFELPEAGAA